MRQEIIYTVKSPTNQSGWKRYIHIFLNKAVDYNLIGPGEELCDKPKFDSYYYVEPTTIYHIDDISEVILETVEIKVQIDGLREVISELEESRKTLLNAISMHFKHTGIHVFHDIIIRFEDYDFAYENPEKHLPRVKIEQASSLIS